MIEAIGITKRFGSLTALDGLSTRVPEGSIYGLVGPNGSGKSTLLRLMAGVYRPDAGQLLLGKEPIFGDPAAKGRVFFLPDDLWAPQGATLEEMARFYAGVYPAFHWEEYRRLLELFQADPKKRLSALSKGLRRQAAMLLALSCRTPCLLLDEVFDGLDPVARRKVKKLLYQEIDARGGTVVISSHDLRELEDLCDRVALLHRGQIRLERGLDELKQGFCKVQAAFRQPVDWGETGLDILERQQRGDLASLLVRGGVEETLAALERHQPLFAQAVPMTLEEIFIGEMEAAGYDCNDILS